MTVKIDVEFESRTLHLLSKNEYVPVNIEVPLGASLLSQNVKRSHYVKVIEKQYTRTGAIKCHIPLLKPKREINIYYK